jgi:hypothetical protein
LLTLLWKAEKKIPKQEYMTEFMSFSEGECTEVQERTSQGKTDRLQTECELLFQKLSHGSACAYSTPKQPPIPMQTLPLIPIQSRPGVPLNTRQWAFAVAGWLVMGYNVAH